MFLYGQNNLVLEMNEINLGESRKYKSQDLQNDMQMHSLQLYLLKCYFQVDFLK